MRRFLICLLWICFAPGSVYASNVYVYDEHSLPERGASNVVVYGEEQASRGPLDRVIVPGSVRGSGTSSGAVDSMDEAFGKFMSDPRPPLAPVIHVNEPESNMDIVVLKEVNVDTPPDNFYSEIGIKTGYLTGDATYEISFPFGSNIGRSLLEFPMDNFVAGADVSIGLVDPAVSVNLEGWITLEDWPADDMADFDWDGDLLWSHTNSEADMDAFSWDVNVRYDFAEQFLGDKGGTAGVMIGYQYQDYHFGIYGIEDILAGMQYSQFNGVNVLDYDLEFRLPYIGLRSEFDRGPWGITTFIKYSPYAVAKDYDNHILRGKTAEIKSDGYAVMVGLEGYRKLSSHWKWIFGTQFTMINTEGNQTQHWYRDEDYGSFVVPAGYVIDDIDAEITSYQTLIWMEFKYAF